MKKILENFINLRFALLPIFISIHYLQLYFITNTILKIIALIILILALVFAILANFMWIEHFRQRVFSGIKFMIKKDITVNEEFILEQHRWAGVQILAITLLILGGLWQISEVKKFGDDHIVPVLVTALLIFIALFDAALDLSAVQTVGLLSKTKNPKEEAIGKLFYNTNQYNEPQKKLSEEITDENSELRTAINNDDAKVLSYKNFSGQAQNIIAIAIIVVMYISAIAIFHLYQMLKLLIQT